MVESIVTKFVSEFRHRLKLKPKPCSSQLMPTYIFSRMSRWNHTKIFSDFSDEENGGSDMEYMDGKTATSQRSKAYNSKASLRSVIKGQLI